MLNQLCRVPVGQVEVDDRQVNSTTQVSQYPACLAERPCLDVLLEVHVLFEHNREDLAEEVMPSNKQDALHPHSLSCHPNTASPTLAMVLAAAAPAFAQSAVAGSVQYVDCDQIQAAIGQYQNADAEDFSAVAQELGVDQNQVLACFQSVAAGRDINVNTATAMTVTATASASASATATASATSASAGGGGGGSASASASALPPTGGVSVPGAIALGAGVLLVAGGLLARRIVR